METVVAAILAFACTLCMAIPPPDFGFPEAPNDTALAVAFPQPGGTNIFVQEACLFGINITAQMPNIGVRTSDYQSLADYNGSYIAVMVDPDASYPENPTKRFYLHWLQTNLMQSSQPGNDDIGQPLINGSTSATPDVPYVRPSPPSNSSAHRYIIYAFQQPADFRFSERLAGLSGNRASFNLTDFISEAQLGDPAAANYFYVSNQSTVPANFNEPPGSQYPGGDGTAVTSGDPYKPTAVGSSSGAPATTGTASTTGGAPMITGAGALLGAGLVGLAAIM